MKNWIILVSIFCLYAGSLGAQTGKKPSLSKEEFRSRQIAFITERAGLSPEEASSFFPVYFELQDKKKEINGRVHRYFKKGKDPKTTDAQYSELTNRILKTRIESGELEMNYFDKFKKILPPAKLFKVQQAEMKFHRELLRKVNKENLCRKN